ncbi:MAG: tRNA (adenosine(37)-N6)-threonylcarbamoyltransferase complex ATPase subunit type 1 TsaE [Acidobacteria bacterium]|jgi:tRNA threonylcarbamoyladenosine biosynthesis protein TsaE|nr:tRNA (adenosine(37)-N6)-threonylcarbamoyltransferase complex ATPase subunit type 1 TsaE [Acidobacteriota bacterium]
MDFTLLSSAPEETWELGRRLGGLLRGDEVILVSGELGAGKTVFIQGLASGLDIPASEVVSPSYVLMNLHSGRFDLYHFDLYRLGRMPATLENPLDECIGSGVLAVEWAQYLDAGYFDLPQAVAVAIDQGADNRRRITVRSRLGHIALS